MDGDRKYRQHGYQDFDRGSNGHGLSEHGSNGFKSDRPKSSGPRPPIDITGPKLPRLVQNVAASRCFSCTVTLPPGTDFKGNCPKCSAALHCCKQCVHFDSSTRFQCLKPIPARIPVKDQANDCTWFSPRVTVARDSSPSSAPLRTPPSGVLPVASRNASDARAAFDNLFKK